ncbi:MAG TPA: hypothetical protein VK546_05810, partial [Gaiellales bacterium]|nr:hypothetical protein [Gaiellales bacterium]
MNELSVQLAREDWRSGERIVERILADPARAPIATSVMRELQKELRRRLGQTYTLAALTALYGDADRWGRAASSASSATMPPFDSSSPTARTSARQE